MVAAFRVAALVNVDYTYLNGCVNRGMIQSYLWQMGENSALSSISVLTGNNLQAMLHKRHVAPHVATEGHFLISIIGDIYE